MSLVQLKSRLTELNFHGMIPMLETIISRTQSGELHITEALDTLIEEEWRHRQGKAINSRKVRSKIRRGACLEEFDLSFNRGVNKADLRVLSKLDWCHEGKPVLLIGPTGAGKTYLARALGLLACDQGKQTLFLSITDFLENQALARANQTYLKFRLNLVRPDVLILDDFGMRKFSAQEAEDLRDVIEQRSYGKSTIITTQLSTDHWGECIGDAIILDALLDRLEPPGIIYKVDGPSYRDRLNKKLVKKTEVN